MIFNREAVLQSLEVAKLAIDQREFIPILAHFCFQGKTVTAYNDFIGIQVAFRTNFVCALQANTLLRLLNSVTSEEIELGFTDQRVYFKSGKSRTGVRARLPYMEEEDFFFKWPNLKRLTSYELTEAMARRMFKGIELCLSSVGDQTPAQMGITLGHKNGKLRMYSTNNKAISRYSMTDWGEGFDNKILSVALCNALLKASAEFGNKDVVFAMAENFVVVSFGNDCKVYGKLVNNKDPLDFDKAIAAHAPKNWRTKRQEIAPGLAEGFERALLILTGDLSKAVTVTLDLKTVSVEATSPLGKLKSGAKFRHEWKADKFSVDAELAVKAIAGASHVYFGKRAIIFSEGNYMHLLSTQAIKE